MQFRAHRGCPEFPENTMIAFEKAVAEGFEQIETDPQYTKDGVIVLIHDTRVNRTCRNSDGSEIIEPVFVSDLTYEELMQLDAGIAFGEEYRGTKVPRLEELLELLDGKGILLDLDKKIPTEKMGPILELTQRYNIPVEFSCGEETRIQYILSRMPKALINYDGNTREEDLQKICALVPPEQLTVWMYYDNENFKWLTDRYKTSPENCARVKKYAKLGIANILIPSEMRNAIRWDADVIEIF